MRRPDALLRTLALLAVAATSAAPTCAASAGPVWSIHRPGGGTVYLAGSVHVLDTARSRLPPAFDSAWRDAERVVMELDMDDLDPAAAASFLAAHATIGDGENLRTLLGAERFARVDTQARALGLSLDSVAQLEPWAVALALTQLQLVKLGLDPAQGVEQQLTERARAEGKPIAGLETIDEQLGVLDGLSYMDQARFLELTAGESDSMATELDGILTAWRRADTAALERLLLVEYERLPTLYGPLVTDRNRRWLPQIEALLARPDDTLVVVGTLHLVGPDGLLALLKDRGLVPTPVGTVAPLRQP
ncbi:MAG: TraB/GumN family protein [Steroidobacteraceae bacterium]